MDTRDQDGQEQQIVLNGIEDVLEHVNDGGTPGKPDVHDWRMREDSLCCCTLVAQIYGVQSGRDAVEIIRALNTVLKFALPETCW